MKSAATTEEQRISWVDHQKRNGHCFCLACWQRLRKAVNARKLYV